MPRQSTHRRSPRAPTDPRLARLAEFHRETDRKAAWVAELARNSGIQPLQRIPFERAQPSKTTIIADWHWEGGVEITASDGLGRIIARCRVIGGDDALVLHLCDVLSEAARSATHIREG